MKFPSNAAAVLVGAVGMPVFIIVYSYAQKIDLNSLLVLLWNITGFFIPLVLATVDRDYIRKVGGLMQLRISEVDLTDFFIPAIKRVAVWFVSMVVSVVSLKFIGIL